MENLIVLLEVFDFVAFVIFFSQYIKKESMKSIIGWMITSAIMCILQFIGIVVDEIMIVMYGSNLIIYLVLFIMSIYAIIKLKKN